MYQVLSYYHLQTVDNPAFVIAEHSRFLFKRDVRARIYVSEQGINGQLSAAKADAKAYMAWMGEHPIFKSTPFKIQEFESHVCPRLTIKYRRQLVALDHEVDLSKTGKYVSPRRWKEMLEDDEDRLIIDVRNDYETAVGHFEGSELPACEKFRDFPAYLKRLRQQVNPKNTPVMMCCTGGIRCEFFSPLMREEGFDEIYQLKGGIISYGQQIGSDHWLGKLFVFDDRLTIPLDDQETKTVGKCLFCQAPSENYYNCANMDCNHLFLSCNDCIVAKEGCCADPCQESERRRPANQQYPHKPFRKWYYYAEKKADLCSLQR